MDATRTEEMIIKRDVLGYVYSQTPLIRCKDCDKVEICCIRRTDNPEWFCADAEKRT